MDLDRAIGVLVVSAGVKVEMGNLSFMAPSISLMLLHKWNLQASNILIASNQASLLCILILSTLS